MKKQGEVKSSEQDSVK